MDQKMINLFIFNLQTFENVFYAHHLNFSFYMIAALPHDQLSPSLKRTQSEIILNSFKTKQL